MFLGRVDPKTSGKPVSGRGAKPRFPPTFGLEVVIRVSNTKVKMCEKCRKRPQKTGFSRRIEKKRKKTPTKHEENLVFAFDGVIQNSHFLHFFSKNAFFRSKRGGSRLKKKNPGVYTQKNAKKVYGNTHPRGLHRKNTFFWPVFEISGKKIPEIRPARQI